MTEQEKTTPETPETSQVEENEELETPETEEKEVSDNDLTVDDFHREKTRRTKAEKSLVEAKRRIKELEKAQSEKRESDVMTKAEYALEKFLTKNPELEEHREELEKYTKRGFTLDEAKILVLNADKTIQNRKKLESMSITDGDGKPTKNTVTRAELEKMSQSEYNTARKLMEEGKLRVRD